MEELDSKLKNNTNFYVRHACKYIIYQYNKLSKQKLIIISPSYIYNPILYGINSFLIYYTYVIINIYT